MNLPPDIPAPSLPPGPSHPGSLESSCESFLGGNVFNFSALFLRFSLSSSLASDDEQDAVLALANWRRCSYRRTKLGGDVDGRTLGPADEALPD